MILVRYKNGKPYEIVAIGDEKHIIEEIHNRGLEDYHDAFFYERGKFENLGMYDSDYSDYYMIAENNEDLEKILKIS